MFNLIELRIADGSVTDVPPKSITFFKAMDREPNPNFPNGKTFVRWTLGEIASHAIIENSFDDMIHALDINVRPEDWMTLRMETADRVALKAGDILMRKTLPIVEGSLANSEIAVACPGQANPDMIRLIQSRDEVKERMDAARARMMPPPPPSGERPGDIVIMEPGVPLAPAPVPTPTMKPARKPRSPKPAQ